MFFRRILQNETGQMAIFIALIFQVLFVLFAMVINIGLIVHDKINLQNSVDLAAYYAAERQAEAMNMIAHINYQMRQDYKLLTWRYRVLGSFGSLKPMHPALSTNGDLVDVDWSPGKDSSSVCMAHRGWNDVFSVDKNANNCKYENMRIPDLKPIGSIPALAIGINFSVADQFKEARNIIRNQCQKLSPFNWGLATMMIASFKTAGSQRKKQIQKLASQISSDADFIDIQGNSVREGALKTFEKNLTSSNKAPDSFLKSEQDSFVILNGLSQGGCGQLDELGFPAWLQDIPIEPIVRYTELVTQGSGSQCDATTKAYSELPSSSTIAAMDPSGELRKYAGEPAGKDWLHSSRGFEKNPWCLAYVAIKAKTKPRKPFAPFGSAITMEARAYAEPFGGRIGPWYGKTWAAQASQSDSSNQTDELAVPRGSFDASHKELYLPNYSRYPGDRIGMRSKLALGMMRSAFSTAYNSEDARRKFNLEDYGKLIPDIYATGDPLAWSPSGVAAVSRVPELDSVTPDLFDLAYYSVDPEYYKDYFLKAKDKVFQGIAPMSDLGARQNGSLDGLRIKNQIQALQNDFPEVKDAFYITKKWEHLLTGWIQGGAVDYNSRSPAVAENFGNCKVEPGQQQPAVAGACVAGGRVGYSVRLIHKEYLQLEHEVGGSGAGKDRFRNAPDPNF